MQELQNYFGPQATVSDDRVEIRTAGHAHVVGRITDSGDVIDISGLVDEPTDINIHTAQ